MVMGNEENNLNTSFTFTSQGAPQVDQALKSLTASMSQFANSARTASNQAGTAMADVARNAQQTVSGGRGGSGFNSANMPVFAQFALYPVASLAGRFGAQGLAQGLFGIADIAGTVDNLAILNNTIVRLGERVRTGLGPLSSLAQFAGNLATPLGATASAFASILAVAAPLALVIGGVSLVISELTRRSEEAKKAAEDYSTELERQAGIFSSGQTTADVQVDIDRDTSARDFVQNRQQSLEGSRDALESYYDRLIEIGDEVRNLPAEDNERLQELAAEQQFIQQLIDAQLQNASNITGAQITSLDALNAAVAAGAVKIEEYNQAIENNTNLINSGSLAYNDSVAAAEALAQREDELLQARLSALEAGRNLTDAQLEQKVVETLQQYASINEELASNTNISAEYRAELVKQRDALEVMAQVFNDLKTDSFVEALQKAIPAFRELQQEIQQLTTDFIRDQQRAIQDRRIQSDRDTFDFVQGRIRDIEDFTDELRESESDYQEDRQRSIDDFYASLNEEEDDQEEADLDRLTKFNREEARRLEDHQDRLSKIVRDANDDIASAIGNRDALAAYQAAEKAKKDIADENEAYGKARARRLEDFALQIADENKQDEKMRARRIRNFERQLADQENAFNRSRTRRIQDFNQRLAEEDRQRALTLSREREDFRRQELLREQDFNLRISRLRQQFLIEQGLNVAFQNEVSRVMTNVRNTVTNALNSILNPRGRAVQQYSSPIGPPVAGGNTNINDTPFRFLTQPNAFGNANTGQNVFVLNNNISGQTREQVRREMQRGLNRFVEAL